MEAKKDRLYNDVKYLTEVRPYRNYRNLQSLEQVCVYIEQVFNACGLKSERQTWQADGNEYNNIIASYNTQKSRRLVIGAHYDVCGDQPGADDNASAVAGLLETARLVAEEKPGLDYRIDFVAYCLEEPPFFAGPEMGSYIHAKSLAESNAEVIGMVCYEMIGYFSDKPGSQPFPSPELAKIYPHTGNFIIAVGIEKYREFCTKFYQLMHHGSKVDVQVIVFPDGNGLAGMSDQRSYWKFGFPALMINDTAFIRNPNYHQKSDTIETLDFKKMREVVNSCYRAITNIVQPRL